METIRLKQIGNRLLKIAERLDLIDEDNEVNDDEIEDLIVELDVMEVKLEKETKEIKSNIYNKFV